MVYLKQLAGLTISTAAPSNPIKGDLWHEVDSAGVSRYGWFWNWDGSRWLSPEQIWQVSIGGITGTQAYYLDTLKGSGTRSIRVAEMVFTAFTTMSQNAVSYWRANLFTTTLAGGNSSLGIIDTTGNAANVFTSKSALIPASTSDPILQFYINPNGMPGTLYGVARLKYYFYR